MKNLTISAVYKLTAATASTDSSIIVTNFKAMIEGC